MKNKTSTNNLISKKNIKNTMTDKKAKDGKKKK